MVRMFTLSVAAALSIAVSWGVAGAEEAAAPKSADSDFAILEKLQNAANEKAGPRFVPARSIPVPSTVSPQVQPFVAAPYSDPLWNANPKSAAEWKALVDKIADTTAAMQPTLQKQLGVTVEPTVIAGVKAYIVTPRKIPPANRNRLLLHLHGGGYVYFPGLSGTGEAVLMAGLGGYKVISVDYRMPPDFPYPAAMDDAMAVYRAVIRMQKPRNVGVFGSSTGGSMTLALMLRAKQEGVPLPGAIAPGTPWSDLTETGDSYKTNEWVDNVIVSYNGFLRHAALLYANGHDLKDPQLSPIYGDFHGFPPAILTTGTRDLFLSLTVLSHRKLRRAGVEADLQVFEGLSHAQYLYNPDAPETKEAFSEIAKFFDKHLGK